MRHIAGWLINRGAGGRSVRDAWRRRVPRVAVVDAFAVDSRRSLVLIRRDNSEHLLMIGGPNDAVIEPNIARVAPRSRVRPSKAEPSSEVAPLPDDLNWANAAANNAEHSEPLLSAWQSDQTELRGRLSVVAKRGSADLPPGDLLAAHAQELMARPAPPSPGPELPTDCRFAAEQTCHARISESVLNTSLDISAVRSPRDDPKSSVDWHEAVFENLESEIISLINRSYSMK